MYAFFVKFLLAAEEGFYILLVIFSLFFKSSKLFERSPYYSFEYIRVYFFL